MMTTYLNAVCGGALIGLSAAIFLLVNGRVAGISGIVDGALTPRSKEFAANILFVAGLPLGTAIFRGLFGAWPQFHASGSLPLLAVAGVLVGFGTRLGGGCTSGHGVCGLARLSPRSLVAVALFLTTGILTVLVMNLVR